MVNTTESCNVQSRQHHVWVAFARKDITATPSASKPAAVDSSSGDSSQRSWSTLSSPVVSTTAQGHACRVAGVC